MGFLSTSAKRVFFWTYPRTSWQWDVLCVLILVFIFLTPKSWFENTAFQRSHAARTTIIMPADVAGAQLDRGEMERRAKQLSGRADAQVMALRERRDENGKLIAYEVDIR
jgi:hypothetical protein